MTLPTRDARRPRPARGRPRAGAGRRRRAAGRWTSSPASTSSSSARPTPPPACSPSGEPPGGSRSCPRPRSSAWTRTRPAACAPSATRRCGSAPGWSATGRPTRWSRSARPARRWPPRSSRSAGSRACPAPRSAVVVPAKAGPLVFLDGGATVEATPELLGQFALAGAAFATVRLGLAAARGSGLLTNGEEPGKGDPLRKDAYDVLRALPVDFVGNVEGRDVPYGGVADVVVTDGFTGNVLLKGLEAAARDAHRGAARGADLDPRAPAAAAKQLLPAIGEATAHMQPEVLGGGMLLGVDGVVVVGHGSSSPRGGGELRRAWRRRPRGRAWCRGWPRPWTRCGRRRDGGERDRRRDGRRHDRRRGARRRAAAPSRRCSSATRASVGRETRFREDLDADSLALVEIVEIVEETLAPRARGRVPHRRRGPRRPGHGRRGRRLRAGAAVTCPA